MVLNILRSKKFARRTFIGILIIIIPAFVLWGAESLFNAPQSIGTVAGKSIGVEDFAESLQGLKAQVLLSNYGDINSINAILQNRILLNQMAWERLVLLAAARKSGINISDQDLLGFLSIHPLFQRGGIFNKETYELIVRNNFGMTTRSFEELVRQNLMVRLFRHSLFKNISVTDEELLEIYKTGNDKADISYVFISKADFNDKVDVTIEEAAEYYKTNKANYLSPEKINIEYIAIPFGDASKKDEIVESVRTLYPKLTADPENFEKIAVENNVRYGKTGLFSKTELIPGIAFSKEMHQMAFELEKGQISPPVAATGEEGFIYILRKTDEVAPKQLEFQDVTERISQELRDAKAMVLAKEKADAVYNSYSGQNVSLEDSAANAGGNIQKEKGVSVETYIEGIGPLKDIIPAIVKAKEGSALAPAPVAGGIIIVRVDSIIPASKEEFEKNKADLKQRVVSIKQMEIMNDWFMKNAGRSKLKVPLSSL